MMPRYRKATMRMIFVLSEGISSSTEQQELAPHPFPDDGKHPTHDYDTSRSSKYVQLFGLG